ncbi:D-alanyl-D-alanine carboxypeptidase family protein [Amycolatopsis sp. H20-H5]|uniref:D-alanyl-D-alanine carboxypeptidase family protein n=1 Tax=Amycolatopsis sp. H20-H5 TaxID=3046309 RepID=UPI002DBBF694|nr:D-alanyl-D-alanine carboxypeptidase family protein [Amycolatopsis sp. H20-H5]MEC3978369.1 D-alanyl-D-alanine carboxypeptidase family protein [Amycolatopsis sp. H20-H5]
MDSRIRAAVLPLLVVGALWSTPFADAQPPPPADPGDLRVEAGVAPGAGVPDPRPGDAFADPKVADLQRTAADVQQQLGDLAGRVQVAQDGLNTATARLQRAAAERTAAEAEVEAQQQEVDKLTLSAFTAMGRPDTLRLLFATPSQRDLLDGAEMVSNVRAEQDSRLGGALERRRKAVDAEQAAAGVERTAAGTKSELDRSNADAANRADAVSSELRGPIDAANSAVLALRQAQKKRNDETTVNWKAYTDRLAAAGITPPSAAALRDPARLPAGLTPLPGQDGRAQAGVARSGKSGSEQLVLPAETIKAVTTAIAALGKPYVPRGGGEGPAAYSCDGLVRSVYSGAGLPQPGATADQFAVGRPVPVADVQPGDLVFLGPAKYGVQSVGVVLDGRTMLAADARSAGVVVADLPAGDTVLGVSRPSLGARPAEAVPQRAGGQLTWRCGGVETPPRTAGSDQAAGAWGGFPNGLIPGAALCPIGVGSHVLRCDAAQAFGELSRSYAGVFGAPICVTDSYRTFPAQVDLYRRKPSLAAVPGTSNHGWGLAVDLCGGPESYSSPQYAWLTAHSRAFGWAHPGWARAGGGREEPWHWEFTG